MAQARDEGPLHQAGRGCRRGLVRAARLPRRPGHPPLLAPRRRPGRPGDGAAAPARAHRAGRRGHDPRRQRGDPLLRAPGQLHPLPHLPGLRAQRRGRRARDPGMGRGGRRPGTWSSCPGCARRTQAASPLGPAHLALPRDRSPGPCSRARPSCCTCSGSATRRCYCAASAGTRCGLARCSPRRAACARTSASPPRCISCRWQRAVGAHRSVRVQSPVLRPHHGRVRRSGLRCQRRQQRCHCRGHAWGRERRV